MIAHIVCMHCKKEYDQKTWIGEGECTSHGICQECLKKHYPRVWAKKYGGEANVKSIKG